ncbi:MAG: alpha/beta hydrolase [Acidobacteria bacterium]|nr:MAG: alpha/beta hydrolase [Acidobacteriota bacterium]REK01770.1 MAG: alpha/beta hydrolase [Acidobacteriota bacterium]REK14726.1 MAG: alpha/beta hydrolase [Acidobacteriota bacterium]REK45441.1 MAG: alpha/beta hydrolase [Acidobacteriota bacterium]
MTEALQKKIEFGYAQVGAFRLHYARAGNGPKLVLLLHGFPEFWYSWRHQLVDLSDEYTVVAPDLRGTNLSDKPTEISEYKIDKLVDDAVGLIDQLGFEQAAVVGHDWGGGIAWAIARTHPKSVSKLAVLQTPPIDIWRKNLTMNQLFASWYMFFFQLPKLPEMLLTSRDFEGLAKGVRGTTAARGVISKQDIEEYKIAWARPGTITGGLNLYRANVLSRLFGKKEKLPDVTVPTLFIYGEQDHAILPSTVEGVAEVVAADYDEIRIPEAAHWVHVEARDKVSAALRNFLRE